MWVGPRCGRCRTNLTWQRKGKTLISAAHLELKTDNWLSAKKKESHWRGASAYSVDKWVRFKPSLGKAPQRVWHFSPASYEECSYVDDEVVILNLTP